MSFVFRPPSSVSRLAVMAVALSLSATAALAQTPSAQPGSIIPGGTLDPATMAVDLTVNLYAALEYCGVDEDRLQSFKSDMRSKAQELQRIPPEKFDEMFAAALPEAQQQVNANAAAHPEETEQFCEKERSGL